MLISVVIPTKNRSVELKRAITSVLNQTYQNFEVLVIDDHSDEDILKVIQFFQDDRIHYFKSNKQPSNANVCRNIGIVNAKGDYIAMLDSDDEWLPQHLEKGIVFIEEHKCDGVFGGYILDDGIQQKYIYSRPLKDKEFMVNYLLSDGVAVTPSQIYKRNAALSILWDESLLRHQDLDFSIRFSNKYKFYSTNYISTIVHWRLEEKRTEHFDSQIAFMKKYEKHINKVIASRYHSRNYHQLKNRIDVSPEIINFFKINSVKNIECVSLNDYLAIKGFQKNKLNRFFLRLKFSTKVLFK